MLETFKVAVLFVVVAAGAVVLSTYDIGFGEYTYVVRNTMFWGLAALISVAVFLRVRLFCKGLKSAFTKGLKK